MSQNRHRTGRRAPAVASTTTAEPHSSEPSPAAPIIEYYDSADMIPPLSAQSQAHFQAQAQHNAVQITAAHIGIYGWRKYVLYAAVLVLLALSIINIGLLVWIVTVLNITGDHAGPMHFTSSEVQILGQAQFTQGLVVANLSGFNEAQLLLQSNADVRLQSDSGGSGSQIVISAGMTQVTTESFQAATIDNLTLPYFEATTDAITLRAKQVQVESASGMTVSGSVQANQITNAYAAGQGLTLESLGQDLTLTASQNMEVASNFGAVSIQALSDVSLTAGADIVLQANNNIFLMNLPVPTTDASENQFQICMCASDQRLYRVSTSNNCEAGATEVGC